MVSLPTSVMQAGARASMMWLKSKFFTAEVWDLKDHHKFWQKKVIHLKHKNFRYSSQILVHRWFLALTCHLPLLVETETFITFTRISYINKQMPCIHFYINIQTSHFSVKCAMSFTDHYQNYLIKLIFGFWGFFFGGCIFLTLWRVWWHYFQYQDLTQWEIFPPCCHFKNTFATRSDVAAERIYVLSYSNEMLWSSPVFALPVRSNATHCIEGQIHPRALAVSFLFQSRFTKILKQCNPSCIICETQFLPQNNATIKEAFCGWKRNKLQGTLKDDLSCQNFTNGKQGGTKEVSKHYLLNCI